MAGPIESMQPGDVSDVIETGFGCNLLQLVERREFVPVSFEDAEEALTARLSQQKMEREYLEWLETLRKQTFVSRKGLYGRRPPPPGRGRRLRRTVSAGAGASPRQRAGLLDEIPGLAGGGEHDEIVVRGARTHNLRGIDVTIPRDRLVVITGPSGSGKSSLAFDTLYAEGQRRYVESLSAYARQFLDQLEKPDVESVDGLSPALSIEQRSIGRSPRSTVGTATEISDYLRLLYARAGEPFCHQCGREIARQTVGQMTERVMALPEGARAQILAPIVRGRQGAYKKELDDLRRKGYVRARIDGEMRDLSEDIALARQSRHDIDVVVDRIVVKRARARSGSPNRSRPRGSLGDGVVKLLAVRTGIGARQPGVAALAHQRVHATAASRYPEIAPRMFSFNNPGRCVPRLRGARRAADAFDPALVVPDAGAAPARSAIEPWQSQAHETLLRAGSRRPRRTSSTSTSTHRGDRCPRACVSTSCTRGIPAEVAVLRGTAADAKRAAPARRRCERRWKPACSTSSRGVRIPRLEAIRDAAGRARTLCEGTRLRVGVAPRPRRRSRRSTQLSALLDRASFCRLPRFGLRARRKARTAATSRPASSSSRSASGCSFLVRRRPRVPQPRSAERHALGRGGTADPAGDTDRFERCSVCSTSSDEPSIGLHARDNARLLREPDSRLRDNGEQRGGGRARRGDHPRGRSRESTWGRERGSTAARSSPTGYA